jgi:DNA-binding response OmpR family regulator
MVETSQVTHILTSPILEWGGLRMDVARHMVKVDNQPISLTMTEFDLLRALMENPGYVFTRSALIERSLGHGRKILARTLDTHIKNLRRKIESNPEQPKYIQTIRGLGYCLDEPRP